jgi:hypothetical protein
MRRGGGAWSAAIWLSVALFALRALLPTGFMPDPGALRAGHFQIVYCPAFGPVPPGIGMDGGMAPMHSMHGGGGMADMPAAPAGDHLHAHQKAPDAPHGAGMAADCAFGLGGTHAYLPPLPNLPPALLILAGRQLAPAAVAAAPNGTSAGPPVGSRAPPYRLD